MVDLLMQLFAHVSVADEGYAVLQNGLAENLYLH